MKEKNILQVLRESRYTVVLSGVELMKESGYPLLRDGDESYEIEEKYGYSFEEIFSSSFYSARKERFFRFYKEVILKAAEIPPGQGFYDLKQLQDYGLIHSIITRRIAGLEDRAGCRNVINLHGSIYKNQCPRCKRMYPISYMLEAKRVPLCEECNMPIRPLICLSGEMVDSQNMTRTTQEISQADVLLLLGTTLGSEVFKQYVKYFSGRYVVVIHKQEHYTDKEADLLIMDYPMNVLPQLHYGNETGENA